MTKNLGSTTLSIKPTAKKGCGHYIGLFLVLWLCGLFISGPISGAVLAKGWEWFVADTFGITTISFVQAWGISVLTHMLTYNVKNITSSDDADDFTGYSVYNAIFSSVMYSGLAFLSFLTLSQFL